MPAALRALLALLVLTPCLAAPVAAAPEEPAAAPEEPAAVPDDPLREVAETEAASQEADEEDKEDDPTYFPTLEFPGDRVAEALRLHFQSRFLPDAGVGDAHTSLYRPELRGRLTVPFSARGVVRISALGGMGRYDFRGSDEFFDDSVDLWEARLSIQGAYLLNERFHLWREDERWSFMAGFTGGSDFESGAFEDGLRAGVGLGFGFDLPGKLQLAAGVTVATRPGEGGIDVGPVGEARWNVTERWTIRNRGLGLQIEYWWSPTLEVFATGFRETESYALSRSSSGLDDLLLHDRMLLTGLGFEWKLSKHLRINAEGGAVAWRRLRVRSDDLGTIASRRGDPAFYFELRFEVRP